MIRIQNSRDGSIVRLTTDDTELLLPALAQAGAAFRLSGPHSLDVIGIDADDIAVLAALHNARVVDLETVPPVRGDADGAEGAADRRPPQRAPRLAA